MRVSIIAAHARNHVIGINNSLPWNLPADLQHFKKITLGKPVIMGRKTYESIGRPLPGRLNIIITRDQDFSAENCVIVHNIDAALAAASGHEEVMIIGGASFYEQALPYASRMYLTIIDEDFNGDAYFPAYDANEWQLSAEQHCTPDDKNPHHYRFIILDRIAGTTLNKSQRA